MSSKPGIHQNHEVNTNFNIQGLNNIEKQETVQAKPSETNPSKIHQNHSNNSQSLCLYLNQSIHNIRISSCVAFKTLSFCRLFSSWRSAVARLKRRLLGSANCFRGCWLFESLRKTMVFLGNKRWNGQCVLFKPRVQPLQTPIQQELKLNITQRSKHNINYAVLHDFKQYEYRHLKA